MEAQTTVQVDHTISEKDKKIVSLLAAGQTVKDVSKAEKLNLRRLKYRIEQLKILTNQKNVAALVTYFIRNKLIT